MTNVIDQAALNFAVSSLNTHRIPLFAQRFPDVLFPDLIPVDTSPSPMVQFVEGYSYAGAGKAKIINLRANDVPISQMDYTRSAVPVHDVMLAADYTDIEIANARALGVNLSSEQLVMNRRLMEELVDEMALRGNEGTGDKGLLNASGVTATSAPNGASSGPLWINKTWPEILKDVNDALSGVFNATNTVALADTVLISNTRYNFLATTIVPDSGARTILSLLQEANVYTAQTGGQPLRIRGMRGLDTAGAGSTQRMVAYRRNSDVMSLYMPMAPQLLTPELRNNGTTVRQAMRMRLTPLHVKLPKEIIYVDGI
jgi:hypothetical protein